MPIGTSVTSFLTSYSVNDHLAPRAVSNFVQDLPPNPVRGAEVSDFAHTFAPSDPFSPTDPYGPALSDFINILVQPDTLNASDSLF